MGDGPDIAFLQRPQRLRQMIGAARVTQIVWRDVPPDGLASYNISNALTIATRSSTVRVRGLLCDVASRTGAASSVPRLRRRRRTIVRERSLVEVSLPSLE